MQKKIKDKKCPICKETFKPVRPFQKVCSGKCAYKLAKIDKAKKDKKETSQQKESLKTKKDYLNELQVIFNTFIRLRDYGKKCISCDRYLGSVKYDAGHFYSVGNYPALRFDEFNNNGQCVHCNQHRHGNLLEYDLRLPERIGQYEYDMLKDRRHNERHYTIEELKELKIYYKNKIKELKNLQ